MFSRCTFVRLSRGSAVKGQRSGRGRGYETSALHQLHSAGWHLSECIRGVQAAPELAKLAHGIEETLLPLGIAKEDRLYSPHLTLARIKNENIRDLREHIAKMTNFDFGTFQVSEFHLYLSKTGPKGSIYTPLASYPLLASESVGA